MRGGGREERGREESREGEEIEGGSGVEREGEEEWERREE
jgi:hypothetical protein